MVPRQTGPMPRHPELTVVGSFNVDLTAFAQSLPSPGETVGGATLRRSLGGKGANQAMAAARLGAAVRFVGAVGPDGGAQMLRDALDEAQVEAALREVSEPTGTALIVVDASGENQIVVCSGANACLDLGGVDLGPHDAVLTQFETGVDLALELARGEIGFLAVNPSPVASMPDELVERADLIVVNEGEYEELPQLRSARRVVVTLGGRGAVLLEHGHTVASAHAPEVEVVDTVGAGDAFCAAITLGVLRDLDPDEALRIACAVGADAVTTRGAQPPLKSLDHYR